MVQDYGCCGCRVSGFGEGPRNLAPRDPIEQEVGTRVDVALQMRQRPRNLRGRVSGVDVGFLVPGCRILEKGLPPEAWCARAKIPKQGDSL